MELPSFAAVDAAARLSARAAFDAQPAAAAGAPPSSEADGASLLAALPLARGRPGVRARIWAMLESPGSSFWGSVIALVVVLAVLTSVVAFVVQSLPQYVFSTAPAWTAVEVACVAVFTAELAARVLCAPSARAFCCAPLNLVDVLAILPFYVELAAGGALGTSGAGVLRMLRLARIFRVFKVARYLPWVRVFSAALAQSVQPLLMLVLIILIGVVIFASLMYYVERGDWDAATGTWMRTDDYGDVSPSPFSSIPAAMWWAVITMTTVGYGDMFPVTLLGRTIATVAALSGVLVVAVPITIISTNFNAEAARLEAERARIRARMLLLQHHFAAKRAGLDAVLDEVADVVRRNAQELEGEVAALLERMKDELTLELQEIVRMAYEKRRVLHLRALAAQAAAAAPAPAQPAPAPAPR